MKGDFWGEYRRHPFGVIALILLLVIGLTLDFAIAKGPLLTNTPTSGVPVLSGTV